MDKFKKYLQQHTSDLDIETPREAVEERIEQRILLSHQRRKTVRLIARYAVAACLLSVVGFGINRMGHGNKARMPEPLTNRQDIPSKDSSSIASQLSPGINRTIIGNSTARTNGPRNFIKNKIKNSIQLPEQQNASIVNTIENNYEPLVQWQLKKLRVTPVFAEDQDYFKVFIYRFREIEADEAVLKNDIKQSGLDDQLMEQLINLCQEKLNVLKSFRREINKMNNRVRQHQPSRDSYFLDI